MLRFFYEDCVISNLQRADRKGDVFTALINGRKTSRLVMDNRAFHHLTGPGRNIKNRIWFYDPGFKKGLVITRVSSDAEGRTARCNSSFNTLSKLVTRPIIAGILAWFMAWVILAVPTLTLYGGNASSGVHWLETATVVIGSGTAALFLSHALWVVNQIKNIDRWGAGSTASYTKEPSPAPTPLPKQANIKAPAETETKADA